MAFEIINILKKQKGMTNAQLAEQSGVTLSTIDKITSGVNTNPKLDTLLAICEVLGCTLNDFHNTTPNAKNDPANPKVDEAALDAELIDRLCRLTPEEAQKVDAFAQGLLASRSSEPSPGE